MRTKLKKALKSKPLSKVFAPKQFNRQGSTGENAVVMVRRSYWI